MNQSMENSMSWLDVRRSRHCQGLDPRIPEYERGGHQAENCAAMS